MDQMQIARSPSLTGRLADFASAFTLDSAPPNVIDYAKLAILDCLGVSVLALSQEAGQAVMAFAGRHAAPGSCTVWGTGLNVSARDAAFCNGVLSHALDYDDRNHSSTFTLAAAIAAGEEGEVTGTRVLEAFIVGREVRNSLDKLFSDRNSGVGPGARGWHSNGILGPIAAACAAGNMHRLDRETMLNAIGLSAGSCGALTRDGGTMAKPFRTGHAAATGLACVLLAESGFSADHTVLEGSHGLLDALSPIPDEAIQVLGKGLGHSFHLESGIKSKPLASCTATHSATEAMMRLVAKTPIDPDAVESVVCDVKPYPLVRQVPTRGFEGRFSMPFCLALAIVHGRLDPDFFTDSNVGDPVIRSLVDRTRHVRGATSVTVRLRDGTELSEPLTKPSDFESAEDIVTKFHRCTRGILTDGQQHGVVDLVRRLEAVTLRELTQMLRPQNP